MIESCSNKFFVGNRPSYAIILDVIVVVVRT